SPEGWHPAGLMTTSPRAMEPGSSSNDNLCEMCGGRSPEYLLRSGQTVPPRCARRVAPLSAALHMCRLQQNAASPAADAKDCLHRFGRRRGEMTNHLTRRQQEVLQLLTHGKSNKEIARALGIAEATTK